MGKLKGEHTADLAKRGAGRREDGQGRAKLGDDALRRKSLAGGTALGQCGGQEEGES